MKKKLLMLSFVAALVFSLTGCAEKRAEIKLGTGYQTGNYYAYGTHLAEMVNDRTDYSMEAVQTTGSIANIRLIRDGYVDMAIAQADAISDAYNGEGEFKDSPTDNFHTVGAIYDEVLQLVVREDSGITDMAGLAGKKISIGEKETGTYNIAKKLLSIGEQESFVEENLPLDEAVSALKDGKIDAFLYFAGAPVNAISKLAEETPVRLISFDESYIKDVLKQNKSLVAASVPADTYSGNSEKILSIGVQAVLIASNKLDPAIESAVASIIKDSGSELKEISIGADIEKEQQATKVSFDFDMYMTLALAVLVLFIGKFLRRKIRILDRFCIPAPVVGGLLFAIITCVLHVFGLLDLNFDETLKTVCMVIFFTSVGFQANLKVLKRGGLSLVIFLVVVTVLIILQNILAFSLSGVVGVDKAVGLCTGSIPMVGGHGTAGAFGPVLEDLGHAGATTLCTAAATFGLVAGSLMGGPLGRRLIEKKDLVKTAVPVDEMPGEEESGKNVIQKYAPAAFMIVVAMGVGTIVSTLLSKTGMTFPVYIGAMIIAAIIRNVGEYSGKIDVPMAEIDDIGGICLSLFLGVAMVTLKLWQLAELALPLVVLLAGQTILMFIFARFVVFNVLGRDYDAAILSAGTCGFGMGATPNAMANMQTLTDKYKPSVKAYLLVPIVGSMFADFINSIVITFFVNRV